ncbi:MAG TPA: hypothetical protein PKD09_13545 [Aggregatilinea sp.]|jgi:hypothetical protein|uniref:hypothetical protein n=1 Tax=Aggregatilinea sp. TaxID=2806333 RepID=UPI002CBFC7D1|nr:hypothetical protein [Aggregatilinea sp.]HML22671.1 hypothetical protein [Aggregatilinea sp.]
MASRTRNEREYLFWEDLPDGRRRYWSERPGLTWGRLRIIKTVDAQETVLTIVHELYDNTNKLVHWRQTFPFDSGPRSSFQEDV